MLVLSSVTPFGVLILQFSLTTSAGVASGDALFGHIIIVSFDLLSKVSDVLMP